MNVIVNKLKAWVQGVGYCSLHCYCQ